MGDDINEDLGATAIPSGPPVEITGLGDVVAGALNALGISRWFSKCERCRRRRKRLNELVPLRRDSADVSQAVRGRADAY
jgi:hypothetical protein